MYMQLSVTEGGFKGVTKLQLNPLSALKDKSKEIQM